MKKEFYYCDLCGKQIYNINEINYVKMPTEYKSKDDKYIKWQTKEICNICIKPMYDIFNSN